MGLSRSTRHLSRPGHLAAFLFCLAPFAAAQSIQPPTPLQVTIIQNITATTIIDCPTVPTCIDNRSQQYRRDNYFSFRASGTGSWSVQMQFADGSPTGWQNFTITGLVTNGGPAAGIGYGVGYHDFLRFVFTGTATISNYSGSKNYWFPIGGTNQGTPYTLCAVGCSGTIGSSPLSISALTHGQGPFPMVTCFTNTIPYVASSCGYTQDVTGNLVITYAGTLGLIQIESAGSAVPAAGDIAYRLNATGALTTTLNLEQQQRYELKADFGAVGDGVTDDTAAITAGLTAAATGNAALHAAFSKYAQCHVAPTIGSGLNVTLFGDGPMNTMFVPTAACIGQSASMMELFTTGAVYLHDFGIDSLNTTGTPFAGNDIYISGTGINLSGVAPASVTVDHLYVAHGQVVGLQCQPCQNVSMTNTTFDHNWWFGASFASGGTTATPVYATGFNVHGNQYIDTPIGLGFSFFLSDISVTGESFKQSSLTFAQVPHAYATVSGITIDGTPDYGCWAVCAYPAEYNAVFLEGVSDLDIGDVSISNVGPSTQGGIGCIGSNLQIPPTGTQIDLPCNRLSYHGIHTQNVNGWPLWIVAKSNGPSPAYGVQNSIKNSVILNSYICGILDQTIGFEVEGNYCDTQQTGGFDINAQNGSFRNNRLHNIGTAGANSYPGLIINGNNTSPSLNIDVFDNEFVDDGSYSMSSCVEDDMLGGGYASQVRSGGNVCRGAYTGWTPTPSIPTLGTWTFRDTIQNFPVNFSSIQPVGWVNLLSGSPGTWAQLPPPVYASCVSATSPVYCVAGPSQSGVAVIAAGATSVQIYANAALPTTAVTLTPTTAASVGTALGVTCNSTPASLSVSSVVAAGWFVVTSASAPVTNPACFTWQFGPSQ